MKKKLLIILLIILLIFALSRFDAYSLLQSIRQIPLWSVALLNGLQILTQLLINVQWHQVAKSGNMRISFRDMFYVNCQGAVVDSITPGVKIGGEVTRAVQISKVASCSTEQAAAIVALQKLFSMSAFLLLCVLAVIYLMGEVPHLHMAVLGVAGLLLLLTAAVIVLRKKLKGFLQILKEQLKTLCKNPRVFIPLVLLSILLWLIYPAKMYILAVQVFPDANVVYIGAITFIAYMVAMIPIFPGGLGGFEATMSGLLLSVGFMSGDAIVVTVLFRFITFWFVFLLSLAYVGLYKTNERVKKLWPRIV